MKTISTHEAKTHLSRYLADIEKTGEEFIIARGKHPVARLVPLNALSRPTRPKVGATKGELLNVPVEAVQPMSEDELKDWGL